MSLFKGRKFLFLPSGRASTLGFLAQLVKREGGIVIDEMREVDQQTTILLNDSFVDDNQNLTKRDLFMKEIEQDPDALWKYIAENSLKCVRASYISTWIKKKNFEISPTILVNTDPVHEDDDGGVSQKSETSDSQAETDIEFHDSPYNTKGIPTEENSYVIPVAKKRESLVEETVKKGVNIGGAPNNELLINALSRLAKRYEMKGDKFRSRGYKLAKTGIERFPLKIESGEQAQREVANVGSSIARKIQIILDTGILPGLDESFDLEKKLNYFTQCHDVGIYTAKRWNILGIKTFSEAVERFPDIFIREWPILFGWSYYEDWMKSISREECETIFQAVNDELTLVDPECKVELQGSYIRGAQECGDIDLLFFKPECDDTSEIGMIMEKVAIGLYFKGYIQCFLQLTDTICDLFSQNIKERLNKCNIELPSSTEYPPRADVLKKFYLGFKLSSEQSFKRDDKNRDLIKLNPADQFMSLSSDENPCRRVDFFCCKWRELGAARIQWTGPKEFNRWFRLHAIQKGMKLTQHGLYKDENVMLESFDDRRIFELLGEEYISPMERNHIVKKRRKPK